MVVENSKMDTESENMERISKKDLGDEEINVVQLANQLTKAIESLEKTINLHCNLLLRNSITQHQPRVRANSVISTMDNMIINDPVVGKIKDMKVRTVFILTQFHRFRTISLIMQVSYLVYNIVCNIMIEIF